MPPRGGGAGGNDRSATPRFFDPCRDRGRLGGCPGVSVADDLDPRLIAGIPAGMLEGNCLNGRGEECGFYELEQAIGLSRGLELFKLPSI